MHSWSFSHLTQWTVSLHHESLSHLIQILHVLWSRYHVLSLCDVFGCLGDCRSPNKHQSAHRSWLLCLAKRRQQWGRVITSPALSGQISIKLCTSVPLFICQTLSWGALSSRGLPERGKGWIEHRELGSGWTPNGPVLTCSCCWDRLETEISYWLVHQRLSVDLCLLCCLAAVSGWYRRLLGDCLNAMIGEALHRSLKS